MRGRAASAAVVVAVCLLGLARAEDTIWPALAAPPHVGGGQDEAAVIVAIEDYNSVSDIPGAKSNGLDWYSYLTDGRGISPARVKLLTDNAATREGITRAITSAAESVPDGGTLWFVFIGHGAPSRDGQDGLLVGWDTQQTADSVYARGIKQSELLSMLGEGRHDQSIALIDACFSGRVSDSASVVEGLMPMIPSYAYDQVVATKTTVLSAGTSAQFAGALPGAGRPAFSYLALGALYGWGDADRDGVVTAAELRDYTSGALSALPIGRSQTPTLTGEGRLPLSAARQQGPSLAAIRRALEGPIASPGGVSGGSDAVAALEALERMAEEERARQAQRARLEAQVAEEVARHREAVQAEARETWPRFKALAEQGGDAGITALETFIRSYSEVTVEVGGRAWPVDVPEISEASELLSFYRGVPVWVGHTPEALAVWQTCTSAPENCLRETRQYRAANASSFGGAVRFFESGCEAGQAWACHELGRVHVFGMGMSADQERGVALAVQACDASFYPGCQELGNWYRYGEGVATDYGKAIYYYSFSCHAGHAPACGSAGNMHGRDGELGPDYRRALEEYRLGCDGGDGRSCYALGYMYERGRGVREDAVKAERVYRDGCSKYQDRSSCLAYKRLSE